MEPNQIIELFYFFEDSFIGQYIRGSTWLFPVIESFHLLGLAVLGGSVVIGDFRLMGFILKTEKISYVIKQTRTWFKLGFCLLVLTGVPLFLSEAVKCYYSRAFLDQDDLSCDWNSIYISSKKSISVKKSGWKANSFIRIFFISFMDDSCCLWKMDWIFIDL